MESKPKVRVKFMPTVSDYDSDNDSVKVNLTEEEDEKRLSSISIYQSIALQPTKRRISMDNSIHLDSFVCKKNDKSAADTLLATGVLSGSIREMYVRLSRISGKEIDDKDLDHEGLVLHELFHDFCHPRPSYEELVHILEYYRERQSIEEENVVLSLPCSSCVILIGDKPCPVVRLLKMNRPMDCLMCLSPPFQLSFFHVLVRLLTKETALEYATYSTRDMHLPSQPDALPSYPKRIGDIIYSLSRFVAKPDWSASTVSPILNLLTLILSQYPNHHLIVPLTRLLGLTAAINISVQEFRLIMDLIAYKSHPNTLKLYLIRALCTASNTTPSTTPRCFFNFSPSKSSSGIQLSLPYWPFKADFAFIVTFRAETFSCDKSPSLLKLTTEDGAGIEIKFETNDNEAIIVVYIYESQANRFHRNHASKPIYIQSNPLQSKKWYHFSVRHTSAKFKNIFSLPSRDELQIHLDNILVYNDEVKFPKIKGAYMQPSENGELPIKLSLAENFIGQTTSFCIFKEFISNASLEAFFNYYTSQHGQQVNELYFHNDTSSNMVTKTNPHSECKQSLKVFDDFYMLDEDADDPSISSELSRANFGHKVLFIIDPRRVMDNKLLDPSFGCNLVLDYKNVVVCNLLSIKDSIISLGGISTLLKIVFAILGNGEMGKKETKKKKEVGKNGKAPSKTSESAGMIVDLMTNEGGVISLIPSILFLVAAFLRNHANNARDMIKCDGVDFLEHLILHNKRQGLNFKNSDSDCMMLIVRNSPKLSQLLVDALIDIRSASMHNAILEQQVISKLLCNVSLWFSEVSNSPGVSLHAKLLPVLSSLAKNNPNTIRECVDMKDIIELINDFMEDTNDIEVAPEMYFRRNAEMGIPLNAPLTLRERRHVSDILLGIVVTLMSSVIKTKDLVLLLQFIAYNLEVVGGMEDGDVPNERFLTTTKLCIIVFYLLQTRPPIPSLFKSLESSFNDTDGVVTFLLCAMVDSKDDFLRSIGVRCVTAFLDVASCSDTNASGCSAGDDKEEEVSEQANSDTGAITGAIKYVGTGFFRSVNSNELLSTKANHKVLYRFLWHILKNHRERIGEYTHAALISFLIEDDSYFNPIEACNASNIVIKPDEVLEIGYCLNTSYAKVTTTTVGADSNQKFRDVHSITAILHVLKFLPQPMKRRWLFDLLTLIRIAPDSIQDFLPSYGWQPSLFTVAAEVMDAIIGKAKGIFWVEGTTNEVKSDEYAVEDGKKEAVDIMDSNGDEKVKAIEVLTDPDEESPLSNLNDSATMFDLTFKLYSMLLGHSVRKGGEHSFSAIEQAASLQRITLNGNTVVGVLLSNLIAELTINGTVHDIENVCPKKMKVSGERHRFLKMSARVVTTAILTNGAEGIDMTSAVRQWRSLRHLTAVAVAVISKCGFDISNLFELKKEDHAVDISGGLEGIRLPDGSISGVSASEIIDDLKFVATNVTGNTNRQKYYANYAGNRRVCVTLAAQILSLLDAFIFPDSLDASLPASQLHGLALVRGTEPRLGKEQGPLLASLVRLSLLLIVHLEPSSIKFLQCCSRLRCFLHWTLELIRESVALGGYSTAFQALTAPLDRLVLAVVILCHHALSKCSQVLAKIESSTSNKFFYNLEAKQKNHRRIFRSSSELREIVLAAYRGRNEVLRAALSPKAYEALQCALEEIVAGRRQQISRKVSREASLRCFISNDWVQDFHGSSQVEDVWVPFMTAWDQSNDTPDVGLKAIQDLSEESFRIIDEYDRALDEPFEIYCEEQRLWAETDNIVFGFEHTGKSNLNKLVQEYRLAYSNDQKLISKEMSQEWKLCDRRISSFWTAFDNTVIKSSIGESTTKHWKLAKYADRLHRRILFVPDRHFKPFRNSAYDTKQSEEEAALEVLTNFFAKLRRKKISTILNSLSASNIDFDPDILVQSQHMQDLDELEESDDEIKEVSHIVEEAEENDGLSNDSYSWTKEFAWSDGEHFVQSFDKVSIVTLQTVTDGEIVLTTHSLYFRPYGDTVNIMTRESVKDVTEDGIKCWRLSRLTEVHGRRYILRAQALELLFVDAFQLFIHFTNGTKIRDKFYHRLRSNCKVPMLNSPKSLNPRVIFKKSKITELWRKRKISNFQYIMQLNIMAGRTYNDITQYPVFPWILADYTSSKLDLNDPKTFRDLSKPVGALNPDRLEQLLDRYHDFDCFPEEERFLYGSHYSSPGVVLHYMLRQEPFTTMAIQLQSGRFDCPDRLFFDIAGCWSSCLKSTSDVKELIPEFFTCPEIFLNTNKYDLGKTQTKVEVNDVILPPWANGSAYEFVRLHMLALESEHVSKNLHHWIDLIFGYKQRGPEALKAFNLFHHLSYEGTVDLDKITNEVDRKATESHIQNFGQTPSQLLTKDPHPIRLSSEECWSPLLYEPSLLPEIECYTPPKQYGGGNNPEAMGAVLSIHAFADTIAVIYADMSVGTYKCSYNRNSSHQYQFKNDKLRTLGCRSISLSPVAICANAISSNETSHSLLSKNQKMHDDIIKINDLIGSWCFAVTLGGSLTDKSRRNTNTIGSVATRTLETTAASAITGNKDVSSSVLISCGYNDSTVKVHTLDGLRLKCSENGGHNGPINCLSIGGDGGIMITGGQDCTCRVWVVRHPEMAAALSDGQCSVKEHLLTCINILWGHEAPISCVVFNSDLDINISGSVNGVICIHTVRRCRFIRAIQTKGRDSTDGLGEKISPIKRLASDSSGIFVAYLEDYMLYSFTVNGKKLCSANAGEALHSVQIATGGQMLITGGQNCHVVIRTLHNLAVCCVLDLTVHGPIRSITLATLDFNPLSELMFIGTEDGRVTVVDRDKLKSNDEEYDGLPLWKYHDGTSDDGSRGNNNWWNV